MISPSSPGSLKTSPAGARGRTEDRLPPQVLKVMPDGMSRKKRAISIALFSEDVPERRIERNNGIIS
jgi:hypothetical protein